MPRLDIMPRVQGGIQDIYGGRRAQRFRSVYGEEEGCVGLEHSSGPS